MNPARIIRAKRDGMELDAETLNSFVGGFLNETVSSYQMSAFLMAVYFQGMTPDETASLTRIMVESGEILEFPGITGIKVDKHSTGGVGDLISLVLAPVVAELGVPVPMISGRGLGHTGGTLDKLESIPGLRTDLDPEQFRGVLAEVGFVMGGQTKTLAPADRGMYALRDVTGTVESIPLIVSSILSKKVAAGVDALVLDVKCGRGAFMKTERDALALAGELVRVGELLGKQVIAFVTDMDKPLGNAIGNAVELQASLDCLEGKAPPDVRELVSVLGGAMVAVGLGIEREEGMRRVAEVMESGSGLGRFARMVAAQGGDRGVVNDPSRLPLSSIRVTVFSEKTGWVGDLNPLSLGEAVVELGGGRRREEDTVDPSVGILLHKTYGEAVAAGEPLAEVLASEREIGERVAVDWVKGAYRIDNESPPARTLVRHVVDSQGAVPWTEQ